MCETRVSGGGARNPKTNYRPGPGGLANQQGENEMKLIDRIVNAKFWKDTQGQDLVEYALMAGMVAVAAVAAMPALSSTVNNVFSKIGSIITANVH
jgi:pilus assembly protein Flp/PilA